MTDEVHLKLLRAIEANPSATQRELSAELGVSLGKAHYCLKALVEKGWVKIGNFRRSPNKLAYVYLLTPAGLSAKRQLTAAFLKRKIEEHEALQSEIARLRSEIAAQGGARAGGSDDGR